MPPSEEIATQPAHLLPGNRPFLTSMLLQQVTLLHFAAIDFTEFILRVN